MGNRFICIAVCSALFCQAFCAQFPFPQSKAYPYGIQTTRIDPQQIQSFYQYWKQTYYEEQGDLARIKFDSPDFTVSEGVAYGMVIMVYMDNEQNDTRDEFDKLWRYYNRFSNQNGLMNWKVYKFQNVAATGAASDAEVDAALALLMAHKQWRDQRYLDEATTLITRIRQHEVNGRKYLKPGDQWDDKKNPSYFSTAAFALFSELDDREFWAEVSANSYALIQQCRNATTGYIPDWCSEQGAPLSSAMSYDGIRTPWRMAWAYAWFGHADAKDIAHTIAETIRNVADEHPGRASGPFQLDGGMGQHTNACFIGGMTVPGMVDAAHQDWVDSGAEMLTNLEAWTDNYFGHTLRMLYYLLLSGNMPNLRETASNAIAVKPVSAGTQLPCRAGPANQRFYTLSGRIVDGGGAWKPVVKRHARTGKLRLRR